MPQHHTPSYWTLMKMMQGNGREQQQQQQQRRNMQCMVLRVQNLWQG
jgi:hypothetical protein